MTGPAVEEEAYQEQSDDTEAPLEKIFGFTTDNYFEERGSDEETSVILVMEQKSSPLLNEIRKDLTCMNISYGS